MGTADVVLGRVAVEKVVAILEVVGMLLVDEADADDEGCNCPFS